jgi:hypothetical protein
VAPLWRTDGARTSGGKAPIATQCANTSSQLMAHRDILRTLSGSVAFGRKRSFRNLRVRAQPVHTSAGEACALERWATFVEGLVSGRKANVTLQRLS